MSWTWWAYNHSEPLFMRALQANFTILDICMCFAELLPWKNQKRSTRYPITLQKRDSIVDIFPGVDLGRRYRETRSFPTHSYFFLELRTSKAYKNKQHKKILSNMQPLRGLSRKQLNLNCRKDRLLTIWKPLLRISTYSVRMQEKYGCGSFMIL